MKNIKITEEKLLLVEGKDEEVFLRVLLDKKNISNIQIISSGGKKKFKQLFPAIKLTPNFDKVKSLAVIHDADKDTQATFKSICSVLNNNGLENPDKISSFTSDSPRVGVFIIPNGQNEGKLESLCLSTVKSTSVMECVDSFMTCIDQKLNSDNNSYQKPKDLHKARCRAFLAAMKEDTPSLGIAAEKGYWNFDSEKLKPLLDFLQQL